MYQNLETMIVERLNYPLRTAQSNAWRGLAGVILLLFGMVLSVSAQPSDTTRTVDTTGRLGGSITEITPADVDAYTGPPRPWFYLGAYGGFSLITYDAFLPPTVFNKLLTTLPPSSTFTTGDGKGALVGVLAELPLSENFNIGLRLGYQLHSGQLLQNYVNTADVVNPSGGGATVQGIVDTKFGHISITPLARVAPFSFPLYFYGGPTFLIPGQANFNYTERIGPAGARYRPGIPGVKPGAQVTSRNLGTGDFGSAATTSAATTIGISAGFGYEQPLSDEIGLFGEVQFQPMLGDYLSGLRENEFWSGSSISLVVGFRYGLISRPTPRPGPIVARDTTTIPVTPRGAPFDAVGVTPGGALSDTITISARRVKATEIHALLPYIFFDRDSAIIPERYVKLDTKNRSKFQVERLPRGSTMDIYYNLLNIVGQRIREDRVRQITVTGCISHLEHDTTLALRRAEAVRDYLVTVWRVPAARIKVVAQGLPSKPSLSEVDSIEAERENQRVEIFSDGYIVERPVQLPDTTLLAPIGVVRFLPPPSKPDTTGLVDGWSLDVRIGDSLIKRAVTGSGTVPKQIDFELENRPDLDLRGPVEVSSTLTIRDTLYQNLYSLQSKPVVVVPEGNYEEERNIVGGRYVDTYTLLLFNFDQDQATLFTVQAGDIMRGRIDSTSRIGIVGHTDRIGLPYYNQALSLRRAQYAAQLLNVTPETLSGTGEKGQLYDNKYPEGRYYSRTVTVTVETPIPGQGGSTPRRNNSGGASNATGEEGGR